MDKGPKEQVVTNKLDPRMEQYRNEIFDRARKVSNQGYQPYTGQTVAGPDSRSTAAAGGMAGMPGQFGDIGRRLSTMNFGSGVPGHMAFGSGVAPERDFSNPALDTYDRAGTTGARALSGDTRAIDTLMNPYTENVISRLDGEYDKLRSEAALGANDAATAAGAFGGSRHALMIGERQGQIDRAQGDATAELLRGGYNDMMTRAGTAANLGLGAGDLRLSGQRAGADYALGAGDQRLRGQGMDADYRLGAGGLNLQGQGLLLDAQRASLDAARGQSDAYGRSFAAGDYFRNINQAGLDDGRRRFEEGRDWNLRNLEILKGGASGMPYGNTQTQPLYNNKFNAAAGGASTGFAIGGPPGALIGGVGGLLWG